MRWRKLGLAWGPSGALPWARTHAWLPTVVPVAQDRYRLLFGTRDDESRTHVGSATWSPEAPGKVFDVASEPALSAGPMGFFDDGGALPSCAVEADGRTLLYYTGRNESRTPPLFYSSIGLAVSDDGGRTFERLSPAPIMERSAHDPCLVASPSVLRDEGRWRMWYVSCFQWTREADGLHSYYHVKHAESDDGVTWRRDGTVCIGLLPGERNIARPCVVRDGERYRMWYSYDRGHGYRIGYAESDNGYTWARMDDEAGIDVSPDGFDSEAQSYPWVLLTPERAFLFYNGNRFGRDGVAIATSARS
jgi:hypothetical protein